MFYWHISNIYFSTSNLIELRGVAELQQKKRGSTFESGKKKKKISCAKKYLLFDFHHKQFWSTRNTRADVIQKCGDQSCKIHIPDIAVRCWPIH